MKISVRNKIPATVKEIKMGAVMAEVIVQAGNNQIVAAITKDAVEDLALKTGDSVTALVKSTSVMIQK
ncbi:MAG TPA: TOBE domain-containing protein [Candidatus Acidoferrales bacterium]|nr:TOBE domain-containing protein [Candidatus Acidoferrales bacterium]